MVFEERVGPVYRVILFAMAGFTCLAPYELLFKHGGAFASWGMLPFWVISIGALSVGAAPLYLALTGPRRLMVFDARRRRICIDICGDFGLRWRRRYDFADVEAVETRREEDSEGPPKFVVEARVRARKRPLPIKVLATESDADGLARQLRQLIA